jgi:hypothetical protein
MATNQEVSTKLMTLCERRYVTVNRGRASPPATPELLKLLTFEL